MVKRRRVGSSKPEGVKPIKRGRPATGRRPDQVVIRLWPEEREPLDWLVSVARELTPGATLADVCRRLLVEYAAQSRGNFEQAERFIKEQEEEIKEAQAKGFPNWERAARRYRDLAEYQLQRFRVAAIERIQQRRPLADQDIKRSLGEAYGMGADLGGEMKSWPPEEVAAYLAAREERQKQAFAEAGENTALLEKEAEALRKAGESNPYGRALLRTAAQRSGKE